ncbi:hypothetical protein SAMN02745181_1025 [Rubritalea squalenifaciens DSM 18772]|uniref:Uncharacterized protein n=2 Tax=Rubritalea squalenifaciens TaxID=407226 RepID=A0A1M6EGV8_9BACT|nr:hypothetical protein SAMN02745181_1025 [Rubritalea squalenifaciens DSM 18772]
MNGQQWHTIGVSHSPLVTRVFKAAMQVQKVSREDWTLLGRRSVFSKESPYSLDDLTDAMEAAYKRVDRRAYRKAKEDLTEMLCRYAPDGYEVALPHANQIIYQEIISHPLCRGYYLLEEGFTSMNWRHYNQRKLTWEKALKYRLRSMVTGSRFDSRRPMFDMDDQLYRGCFTVSDSAFKNVGGRRDVSEGLATLGNRGDDAKRRVYVVLDSSYCNQGISWENYRDALVQVLNRSDREEVMVKFHFADARRVERFGELQKALKLRKLALLDSCYCIEDALMREDLVLFGLSSLGYYAQLLGCEVETFCHKIQGFDLESWVNQGWLPREVIGSPIFEETN